MPPRLLEHRREVRRRARAGGLALRILGLVCDTHDSGVALLEDGDPALVLEEERFSRAQAHLQVPAALPRGRPGGAEARHRRHRRHDDALGHAGACAARSPRPSWANCPPASACCTRAPTRRRTAASSSSRCGSSTSCSGGSASPGCRRSSRSATTTPTPPSSSPRRSRRRQCWSWTASETCRPPAPMSAAATGSNAAGAAASSTRSACSTPSSPIIWASRPSRRAP